MRSYHCSYHFEEKNGHIALQRQIIQILDEHESFLVRLCRDQTLLNEPTTESVRMD